MLTHNYDVVLLCAYFGDSAQDQADSIDWLRRLRSERRLPPLVVVAASGSGGVPLRVRRSSEMKRVSRKNKPCGRSGAMLPARSAVVMRAEGFHGLTVLENIEVPLRVVRAEPQARAERVHELLEMVGLPARRAAKVDPLIVLRSG